MRFPCVELEVSQLGWSEERLNHVLKIDGDKLFKDLLTNKIFSRQILSWNFKMKFCLNRGLVSEFLGWKLIVLSLDKTAARQVRVTNSKIDGS